MTSEQRSTARRAAPPGQAGPGELADQLSDLARSMQQEQDLEAVLAAMVHAALELVPGAAGGSISLTEKRRRIRSYAPSSDLASALDRLQEQHAEGPCLDAAYQDKIVRVPDFRRENRWPRFAASAVEAGAKSMLCFQLWVDGDSLGALNIYGGDYEAFGQESEQVGLLVAAHAAVAFADAQQIGHLRSALATRDLIGQAKGILMERFRISDQQAFVVLTTASSRTNMKLHDIAEHLVSTGALPDQG